MFLKNYTSEVPVHETIANIERTLIKCKVSGITREYDLEGGITALLFHINLDRNYSIRLFANADAAQDALYKDYMGDDLTPDGKVKYGCRKQKKRGDFKEQARRTAWKLQQDWVEVQMSLVQMNQVDFLQVFVAYLYDHKTKKSFYQTLSEGNGLLALPAST